MATKIHYKHTANTTTNNGAKTFDLPATPTAGNTMVFVVIMDKNKTMSSTPAGFTQIQAPNNPQVSAYAGLKIAVGNETSIAFNVGSSTNTAVRMLYWEYAGDISLGGSSASYLDSTSISALSTGVTSALATTNGVGIAIAAVDSVSVWNTSVTTNGLVNALTFTNGYVLDTTDTPVDQQGYSTVDPATSSGIPGFAVAYKNGGLTLGGESTTFDYHAVSTSYDQILTLLIVLSDNAVAPVITDPTPTGTLGTRTSATLGVTTDSASGTLYAVVSTVANDINNIPTNSGSTVVDGKVFGGANAPFALNGNVTTTSPSLALSGITGSTTYYAALVQVTASGISSVVKTSFTTATSVRAFSLTGLGTDVASVFTLLASKAVKVWTATSTAEAAVDGGSTGLDGTITAGTLDMTNLTIAAGTIQVRLVDPTDALNAHMYTATATEVN